MVLLLILLAAWLPYACMGGGSSGPGLANGGNPVTRHNAWGSHARQVMRAMTSLTGAKGSTDDHPIPRYQRGKNPNWLTPRHARKRGLAYTGTTARLRAALHKLQQGGKMNISVVGGSNTVGNGAGDGWSWPWYLQNWLDDTFPSQVQIHNGAIPSAMSNYMAVCTSQHVPSTSDIVVVEYTYNDVHQSQASMDTEDRRALERLLRKLLKLPNHPAVILLHTYSYRQVKHGPGGENFWGNAERDFSEFERYYDLPAISVKACCYHLMLQNVTGFRVDSIGNDDTKDPQAKYKMFYGDGMHGGGHTGYRVMAELLTYLFMVTLQGLHSNPITPEEQAYVAAPLPPPMIPDNWEALGEKCLLGDRLKAAVIHQEGWKWMDETGLGKWGFISTTPGSIIKFKIDTTTPSGKPEATIRAELAMLHSYQHMGQALVKCESGCTCKETTAEGHHPERKVSQMDLHEFDVSKSAECVVSVTVLQSTASGEHKVKVQGLFISDDDVTRRMGTRGVMDSVVEKPSR